MSVMDGPGRAGSCRAGSGRFVSGRFGLGRFITDIGCISKKNNFLFCQLHNLNQYFTSYDDVMFSHITVTGSSLRRSTQRFASHLSPPLANYFYHDLQAATLIFMFNITDLLQLVKVFLNCVLMPISEFMDMSFLTFLKSFSSVIVCRSSKQFSYMKTNGAGKDL